MGDNWTGTEEKYEGKRLRVNSRASSVWEKLHKFHFGILLMINFAPKWLKKDKAHSTLYYFFSYILSCASSPPSPSFVFGLTSTTRAMEASSKQHLDSQHN